MKPVLHEGRPSLRQQTREALVEIGCRPSRRRGQNFLVDANVVRRIVEAADVERRRILEIGSGVGALTEALIAAKPMAFLGVEIDRELAARLAGRFAAPPCIRFVTADALTIDFQTALGDSRPWRVIANLPYSVGTPILLRLLEEGRRFDQLIVMLQREVADRIVAQPGGKDYSPLSIAVSLRARARRLFRVSPGAFSPRPKVDSTVLLIDLAIDPPLVPRDEGVFRQVVRGAFGMRRKTLRRALAAIANSQAFDRAGIDSARRGETLSLEEFGRLADAVVATRELHA